MVGPPEPGVTPLWESARRNCKIRNDYVREALAEFVGTTLLCFFAVGVGIQSIAGGHPFLNSVLGGVFGLMTAVFVAGGISGAHINPAVTFALAIGGKVSWFKVPLYWVSQFTGGYLGAGIAVVVYWAVTHNDITGDLNPEYCAAFSHIGTLKVGTGILDQVVTTAVLVIAIYALVDEKNMNVPFHLLPFFIALVVTAISLCFGQQAGAMLNPARDLSPRLMALSIGCDDRIVMKSGDEQWWLVGFFGPMIGATLGAFIYILLIGAHVKDDNEYDDEEAMKTMAREYNPTRFIPKAQAPMPNMLPPTQSAPINQRPYPQQGINNPGYDGRDDPRFRNGY